MVKNKVRDLTEEQLAVVLEYEGTGRHRGYVGSTLKEFIDQEIQNSEATLKELFDELCHFNLKWPFRTLAVTVEVTKSGGFILPVLDAETIERYAAGEIELGDIDPGFSVEAAYDEIAGDDCYYANCDYAVEDDTGRKLVDWD